MERDRNRCAVAPMNFGKNRGCGPHHAPVATDGCLAGYLRASCGLVDGGAVAALGLIIDQYGPGLPFSAGISSGIRQP